MSTGSPVEVVIAGDPDAAATGRLLRAVRSLYAPDMVLLLVPPGEAGDQIRRLAPFTENHQPVGEQAAAYVCRSFECQLPTTDAEELKRQIQNGILDAE
jgi:uncharacterized protein YyaL (SSP411 family)